jgi:CBS domain containing-hemolysin-like protein
MVPRLAIVGVEMGTPWSEMLDRVRSSEHSRLPAYRESLDDVVGVIVAKDLLPYAITGKAPAGGWESLARPASFVPATKAVADQLREFRSSRTHMAIVVDEYGGTAGILTIEDVLEEVVGEIRDEHDVEEPSVVSENGSRFWVSGRLPVDELEEIIGERLDGVQATTVGGLVFERKGKVPRVGEELVWGRFRVVVERMKRRAVDRVYLERLSDREKAE